MIYYVYNIMDLEISLYNNVYSEMETDENNIFHNSMDNGINYFKPIDEGGLATLKQVKDRAKDLNYPSDRPLRKGKMTEKYIKFLNKKFKEYNDFGGNPLFTEGVRRGQTKPSYQTHLNEGGTYASQYREFLTTGNPFTVDVNDKNRIKYLLDKLQNTENTVVFEVVINGITKHYMVNKTNATSWYSKLFIDEEEELQSVSDKEFISKMRLNNVSDITVKQIRGGNIMESGEFFSYTHNIKNLDLSEFQVFSNKEEISPDLPCCFIQSLISAGVSEKKIQSAKSFINVRNVPCRTIDEIAITLDLHIKITRYRDTKNKNVYPTKQHKDNPKYNLILEKPPIKIGLIDGHYFHIKPQVPITSYALEHYDDIKHINDFHKIYIREGTKYKKKNDRFISSYEVIKILFEHKNKLLTPLSLCDEVLSTQYYDKITEITTLDYDDEIHTELSEYEPKIPKDEYYNVFADFECSTEGDKHRAYLAKCHLSISMTFEPSPPNSKGFVKSAGRNMLDWIVNKSKYKHKNIRLIFHNAGYDIRFLYNELSNYKDIRRGKMLLRGWGNYYYYGEKNDDGKQPFIKIIVQDSYAIIPKPLRDFSKCFNIEVKKEILPYGLYTQENIKRIQLPLNECLEALKIQFKQNNIGLNTTKQEYKEYENEFITNIKNPKWNCYDKHKKLVNIIKYSAMYCYYDCKVLEEGYNKFREDLKSMSIDDEGDFIDMDNYVSISSIAEAYMLKEGVYDNVYQLSGVPREFINKCMYGGRTMCANNKMDIKDNKNYIVERNENNTYERKIKQDLEKMNEELEKQEEYAEIADFDAVSLYPSSQYRLGGYLQGRPKILKQENLNWEFLDNQDGYFIEILIKAVDKSYSFPLMSKVNKDGIREWTNNMVNERFYCDKTTLEDLINYHKIEYEIIRGYYFDEGRNYQIKQTIQKIFKLRLIEKDKGNPIQEVYKLIMNSAYGKTLLKPIEDERKFIKKKDYETYVVKHYNWIKEAELCGNDKWWIVQEVKPVNNHFNLVHCGVEVLSTSKRLMSEVMCLADDLNIKMYITDTDSIHIDNRSIPKLAEQYKKDNKRELIGKNMGQFHTDFDSDILTKRAKQLSGCKIKKCKDKKCICNNNCELLARRSIFLGKKCYIDELYNKYDKTLVDYHIRLKGIPNKSILHYCYKNNITPFELYEKLYVGEKIEFDLTCEGMKAVFKFENNMVIRTLEYQDMGTTRAVKFKGEKQEEELGEKIYDNENVIVI